MKKLIAVVVAMMLALAFTACAQEMKKDEMPKDCLLYTSPRTACVPISACASRAAA